MKFKWKKFSEVLPLFDKLIVVQFDEYEYYVGRLRMLDEDSGVTVISESDETLFNMPIEKLIKFLDANREHEDYYLLCKQLSVMIEYRDCLLERIHKYCGE